VDCRIVKICATENATRTTMTEVTNDERTNRYGTPVRILHIVASHRVVNGPGRHCAVVCRDNATSLVLFVVVASDWSATPGSRAFAVVAEEVDASLFVAFLMEFAILAFHLAVVSLVVLAARPVSKKL
jgi:hypothetical protein